MPEPTWPTIRVRAVRGRVVDPFRGSVDDGAQKLASRATDTQPLDDLVTALSAIPGVKLERAGRRFKLKRADEVLKIAFASAAPRVSLDDATFEGDGALAIAALHALLPLFGAVEVQIGRYDDLIDGHDTLDAIAKRYEAWWIEDSLRLAKKLEARDAARAEAYVAPAPAPIAKRVSNRTLAIAAAIFIALAAGGVLIWMAVPQRAGLGERCTKMSDCASEQCLPREPVVTHFEYLRPAPPSDPTGVCTKRCSTDGDCPSTMQCEELMSYDGRFGLGSRVHGCVPRSWRGM